LHVLISGGAGFLGSHLVDRYLADGHEVTAVDDLSNGALMNLTQVINHRRFRFHPADPRGTPAGSPHPDLRFVIAPDASAVSILAGPLDLRVAHVFGAYGPRAGAQGSVIPLLFGRALAAEPLQIASQGHRTRTFVFVDDVIEGIVRLATRPDAVGAQIDLCGAEPVSELELATRIARVAGIPLRISAQHRPLGSCDLRLRRLPDDEPARRMLGWEPRVGLDEGLARTLDSLRATRRAVS